MKLVTFGIQAPVGEIRRVGAIRKDGKIVDLTSAREVLLRSREELNPAHRAVEECPDRMIDFIKCGQAALDAAKFAALMIPGSCMTQMKLNY